MPQNSLLQHKTWYCICGHKGTFASYHIHEFKQLECYYQWICIWHFLTTLNAKFGQLHLRKSGSPNVTWLDIKYSTYCRGCLSYRPYIMFLLTVNANKGSYVELARGIYEGQRCARLIRYRSFQVGRWCYLCAYNTPCTCATLCAKW